VVERGVLKYSTFLLALAVTGASAPRAARVSASPPDERLIGRWDIAITSPGGTLPSWLEVEHSGRDALVGRFVGVVGSARPVSQIVTKGDSLSFSIPYQWEDGNGDLRVQGVIQGAGLKGSMTFPDGKRYTWTAVRAPRMVRQSAPVWGAPINLLHGNDLGG
jgi:hypothetical protein